MENKEPIIHEIDSKLICDYFGRMNRQGPGSSESTLQALSFIDSRSNELEIADLACGTGGQTITLAKNTKGTIIGLDIFSDFIEIFNTNVARHGLQNRIKGLVGSMDKLPFEEQQFDLIWSEGAIANIGFEKGLNYWKSFLKKDGYVAVTYESWFTDERPTEIEQFWVDAVPEINTIGHNVSIMQKCGYKIIAVFSLPEKCWTDGYFSPQKEVQKNFLQDYAGNKEAAEFVKYLQYEAELYSKYKQHYGYVFYIGQKIKD